ncbi:CAF17-like 4Fe-4S cluster assembly/insertion protein YgfZ [Pseudonocardia asaccharolytica]|nr:glycine cleavage T C-terminal barrel domain-containing protein [Pseudonocardia asaccharolytica]
MEVGRPESAPDPDVAVPAHCGDPLAEQRAMARSAAVVDRSHREVLAVPGADRLSWLHLLLTQHVSELPADTGTEALVLDGNGRVLHHMAVAHVDEVVWLDTEPGDAGALLDYLTKMIFWSKVEPRDATAELAVLSLVGPETANVLDAAGVPAPHRPNECAALPGDGFVRRMPWPGSDAADLLVPRGEREAWWQRLTAAGARPAGTMAFEALRVEAVRPRLHLDTDARTIPHEVGWIGPAVHLTKGCYRGQETVARVANLGRPPRRLVLLHLDAGDEEQPRTGDPVLRDGRAVGRVGTVVLHHELGAVALALVKRSVPADAELVAGTDDRAAPASIDPDSVPTEDTTPPPGRAAQLRGRLRG